jgi:LysR family transcriptional regulator, glycine cleavage system transcriptional activator
MDKRKSLPLAALRAFEATARHGRFTAAAEELGVSHGAISKHIRNLEDVVGTPLFEGVRNRPILTAEGRIFGFALTAAFDQIDDALRIV